MQGKYGMSDAMLLCGTPDITQSLLTQDRLFTAAQPAGRWCIVLFQID